MRDINSSPNLILANLRQQKGLYRLFSTVFLVVLGSVILTISAKINIPFIGVPATFQTMAVALIGAAFGWRLAFASVALYLFQGAMGLPVFAQGGSIAYLFGPTGGFLLGFLPASYIIGKLAENGASKNFLTLFLVMIIGDMVIFAFGYAWLLALASNVSWLDQANLFISAYKIAIEPFIIWDILKMALAAATIIGVNGLIRKINK